jgi:hypothetical protein
MYIPSGLPGHCLGNFISCDSLLFLNIFLSCVSTTDFITFLYKDATFEMAYEDALLVTVFSLQFDLCYGETWMQCFIDY